MINILLDELPTQYEGCEIETDFRIGIMISQAMSDNDLSKEEKCYIALQLLFKGEYPKGEEAIKCLEWFLNGWNTDSTEHAESSAPVMDFNIDAGRIFSAFMAQYGINLNTAEMHWWQFMIMLSCLNECAFTNVIEIRSKSTKGMAKEQKKAYEKAKKRFAIKPELTEDEIRQKKEADDRFLEQMGLK